MAQQTPADPKDEFLRKSRALIFKTLEIALVIVLTVVLTSISFVGDRIIIFLGEQTIVPAASKFPIVAQFFDLLEVGLGFLAIIGVAAYASLSFITIMRFNISSSLR